MPVSSRGTSPHPSIAAVGEWLSLVEHLVRDQGVGGSNPLSPTISFQFLERYPLLFVYLNGAQILDCARSADFHSGTSRVIAAKKLGSVAKSLSFGGAISQSVCVVLDYFASIVVAVL